MTYVIVAAARDRSAIGRGVLAGLAVAGLAAGLMVYELRGRTAAPVAEPPPASGSRHRLVIHGNEFGACYVSARVNGSPIPRLLLDSGAEGHLIFGRNSAAQLGFDPAKLSYSYAYGSANNEGREALVTVREFRIDSFVLRDVPAAITYAAQSAPLIGVAILHRLNFRLKGGNCELDLP